MIDLSEVCIKCTGRLVFGICRDCRESEHLDIPGWRLERAVRRVARRGALLDCRQRARHAREMKRRRKTISDWWQMTVSLRPSGRGKVIPTRLKGFPDSDGWVQVVDDRLPVLMPDRIATVRVEP